VIRALNLALLLEDAEEEMLFVTLLLFETSAGGCTEVALHVLFQGFCPDVSFWCCKGHLNDKLLQLNFALCNTIQVPGIEALLALTWPLVLLVQRW
jgi:hypothetical protein